MSIAVMINSTAFSNARASKVLSSRRNLSRLRLARLHELLSRLMYSEHGLDAVIRPVSGLVCQSLIVSSYWMPGIGALPGGLGHLVEQLASVDGLDHPTVGPGAQRERRRRPRRLA